MSNDENLTPKPFDLEAYNEFKRSIASRGSQPSISNDAAIETPDEVAERGRAMFRRALLQADADDLQEDLRQMLEALGMSNHARPYSPHRVFQEALTEMKRRLVIDQELREAAKFARSAIDRHLGDSDLPNESDNPLFIACQKLSAVTGKDR